MASFTIGGVKPKNININGEKCKKVTVNGETVWTSELNLLEKPTETWRAVTFADTTQSGQSGYANASVSNTSPYLSGETLNGSYVTAGCVTKNTIDFSGYTTLKITGDFEGNNVDDYGTRAIFCIGCSTNSNISVTHNNGIIINHDVTYGGGAELFVDIAHHTGTLTMDISKLNGKYYIKIFCVRGGLACRSYFTVTGMILE